jgi:hypothetical protein
MRQLQRLLPRARTPHCAESTPLLSLLTTRLRMVFCPQAGNSNSGPRCARPEASTYCFVPRLHHCQTTRPAAENILRAPPHRRRCTVCIQAQRRAIARECSVRVRAPSPCASHARYAMHCSQHDVHNAGSCPMCTCPSGLSLSLYIHFWNWQVT